MEHASPHQPATMRMVWPEHTPAPAWRTGYELPLSSMTDPEADPDYPLCKWEERFDICQMHAILHMLAHLTSGLPGPLRRMLLRRADQFPKLHGHFAPYNGRLGFHAEEGEVIGMDECWHRNEDGTTERLW